MMKLCNKCGYEKEIIDFFNNKRAKDGKSAFCKICQMAISTAWIKRNPEAVYRYKIKAKLGVSSEEYDNLLNQQNKVCAICLKSNKNKKLVFDHCHTTGKARGLLCSKCNIHLGIFERNFERFSNYIDEHR